jgi:hypothetical protein
MVSERGEREGEREGGGEGEKEMQLLTVDCSDEPA